MRAALAGLAILALAACTKTTTANSPGPGAGAAADGDMVVATYAGKQVTLRELDASIAKDLYNLRHQSLETMIVRKLVQTEAAKAGKSEEDFVRDMAAKVTQPPSDDEVKKIYDDNKEAFGGRSLDEVKPMIMNRMRQEKEQQGMLAFFESLKQQANVKIMLPEPRTTVAAVGPSKGPQDAPVTIVEFSDFQCPFCSKARATAEQAVTAFAGKVRLVFRDYPLPFHDKAQKAAEAGQCANEQGKFWAMHDWMFDHQDKLDVAQLKEAAKGLGLDSAKFDACLDSGKTAQAIRDNLAAGEEAGVNGTPAFFINGKMISGAQPFEKFKEMIEAELK